MKPSESIDAVATELAEKIRDGMKPTQDNIRVTIANFFIDNHIRPKRVEPRTRVEIMEVIRDLIADLPMKAEQFELFETTLDTLLPPEEV